MIFIDFTGYADDIIRYAANKRVKNEENALFNENFKGALQPTINKRITMDAKARLRNIPNGSLPYILSSMFLILAVFFLDIHTPYGTIHWILYLIPLFLAYRTRNTFYIVVILCLIIAASIAGAIYTSQQPTLKDIALLDIVNRAEGLFAFLLFTYVIHALAGSRSRYKHLSKELFETRGLFQMTFQKSPVATALAKLSGNIVVDTNSVFENLFEYTRDELIGKPITDFDIWADAEERGHAFQMLVKHGKLRDKEFSFKTKTGRTGQGILFAEIVERHAEKYIVLKIIDITERKRAESALHTISSRLEAILSAVPEIIMEVNMNKVYTWANKSGYDFFGDEVIGKNADFYFVGGQTTYQMVQPVFNGDENVIYVESWQRNKNGQKRLLAWWCRTIKDKNGLPVGALSSARDITEIRQAEEALAAEKERLAVTLRSIGDAVIATDMRGDIVLMNKVAENLSGWPFSEAVGKPLAEVFHIVSELTRRPCANPVEKALASGTIVSLENHTLLVARDGKELVIADSGAPIKDRESKTIGVVLVFRDMTEKQKIMDTLQRAAKLESLGILAGGIAHDFNNLIGGIYGYIDLAIDEPDKNKASSCLAKAMATIDRARGLTRQLLTFAKGGDPVRATAHLFPFVQETARFALSGSNVSCRFDALGNLWACSFDKNQIGQVIDNLVINAQQAMPFGGAIELTARNIALAERQHPALAKGNYVRISVRDSGIGMSKELLPRIFDPFFTTKAKGHGLGLATCYSIINRHGGCIDVESEQGRGSTFHVYLPAAGESVPDIIIAPAAKHKGSGTIIIMDDEEVMRDAVSNMLETLGYSVVCKNEGRETLDFFIQEVNAKRGIAALILDLTIQGGMGGKDVVNEIRKLNSEIPVFVASGYADDPIMKNPANYGFTASICKPFMKIELEEMLEKHLTPRK